ncbi:hypothetical protein C8R45DRAFT_1157957 [Mycena sanguinolenta]|nr:hypothetical protein C8R45DRAFT_1157957 [Mycena sanguinolenta]
MSTFAAIAPRSARETRTHWKRWRQMGQSETAEDDARGLLCLPLFLTCFLTCSTVFVGELLDNPPLNWAGGLHRTKTGETSGSSAHTRVLYIDVDIHYNDGGEAFYTTDRVMCASFHKSGEFFPRTGSQDDRAGSKRNGYSLNVPLDDSIIDTTSSSPS